MFATRDRLEELDLYLALNLIFTQICGTYLDLIPLEGSTFRSLDLRLVDWCVLAGCDVSVNDEEAEIALWKRRDWIEKNNLCICRG